MSKWAVIAIEMEVELHGSGGYVNERKMCNTVLHKGNFDECEAFVDKFRNEKYATVQYTKIIVTRFWDVRAE